MRILSKEEFFQDKEKLCHAIKTGAVFIYPTDTIYGVGCNAQLRQAVAKIRGAKKRETTPFSVIVPDKAWIEEHCSIPERARPWLDKLPGPYTIILRMQHGGVAPNVAQDTLGVRMPDHWIQKVVTDLQIPVVTTSVNKKAEPFAMRISEIDKSMGSYVDFAIDDGPLQGKPSTIIHAEKEQIEIVERK